MVPTSACWRDGRLTHVERWPPASCPCTTSASTPVSATARASSTRRHHRDHLRAASRGSARPARRRLAEADAEDGHALFEDHLDRRGHDVRQPGGPGEGGRQAQALAEPVERGLHRAARRSPARATCRPAAHMSVWSSRFTPNGRSVSASTSRMRLRTSSGRQVRAPEDAEAAGTAHRGGERGPATPPMPDCRSGTRCRAGRTQKCAGARVRRPRPAAPGRRSPPPWRWPRLQELGAARAPGHRDPGMIRSDATRTGWRGEAKPVIRVR